MNALLEHLQNLYLPTLTVTWPSLLTAIGLSLAGGVIGLFVLLRRESLLALAMPQIVTLGAAVGVRAGWPQFPPALGAIASALGLLAWSKRRGSSHLLLPALYVAGASFSILLIANAGAHLAEVQNLFTGIDVAVSQREAVIAALLLTTLAAVTALLWRRWLLLAQAPAAAELSRLHPVKWNALFLAILATVLVLGTNAVGPMMVTALLFLPPAAVLPWTSRIPHAMIAAAALGLAIVACGFILSVEMEWPFSHSVGGAGCALFLASHLFPARMKHSKHLRHALCLFLAL